MTNSVIVALMLTASVVATAQLPQTISFQAVATRNGVPVRGMHHVVLHWYASPTSPDVLFEEWYDASFMDGLVDLRLGEQNGLPLDLLATGTVYIGITIDDDSEMVPRTALTTVPFALFAQHAETATALDRDVSGVVTSINEVAGSVRFVGDATTRVTTSGNVITISSPPSRSFANGVVTPDGHSCTFVVRPSITITPTTRFGATVITPTGESIGCTVRSVDPMANAFTIVTAAVLLPTERIHWFLLSE